MDLELRQRREGILRLDFFLIIEDGEELLVDDGRQGALAVL